MNYCLIALFFASILVLDFLKLRTSLTKRERIFYLVLGVLAFVSAFPAAYWTHLDHSGASLSGMLSLLIS